MKNAYYPNLFTKGKIGNLEIKNRIIRNSMGTYLAHNNCAVSDRSVKAAIEAAKGGVGLVFLDNCVVKDMYHMGLSAQDDTYIPGLNLLAEAIKDNGALAGMQLAHPGRDAGIVGGSDVPGASPILPEIMYNIGAQIPYAMTIPQIKEIQEQYGQAALRVMRAGFDLVEIHAAAGCLPCNFLSPHDNTRTDMYGGSLFNRMRFLVEIIRSIKKYCGPSYPISVKLSMDDLEPEGIRVEETIEVCKALENEGVSLLNLVDGTHVASMATGFFPVNISAARAKMVKEQVHIPVMVTGNIQSTENAEEILESGAADFVGTARQSLADPAWPKKAKAGKSEDIVPCIRCMVGCADHGLTANCPLHCSVNPTLFRFYETPYPKTEEPKNVAVIGAGPAGCQAAITLARCGHKATVYEKNEIGGALIQASVPNYKSDIRRLIAYYKTQLDKLGVEVVKAEADFDTIKNGGYDAVIIATGAVTRKLDVPGIENSCVSYAMDYLSAKAKDSSAKLAEGGEAVVIGGGITGAEVALELVEEGKKVTIVEVMDKFLDLRSHVAPIYMQAVYGAGVRVITGYRLESVDGEAAVIVDRFGNKQRLNADGGIVVAAGFTPNTELAQRLEDETDIEIFCVGDCKKARQILEATREGYNAACQIG